jgi:hypothetical protein
MNNASQTSRARLFVFICSQCYFTWPIKPQNKANIIPGCHAKYDKSCIHYDEDSSFNIEVLRGALYPDAQEMVQMDAKTKQTSAVGSG